MSARVVSWCLPVAVCASGGISALLLPVLLLLPPGTPGWWMPPPYLELPGSQAWSLPWGEGNGGRHPGSQVYLPPLELLGSWVPPLWSRRLESSWPPWLEGWGHRTHCRCDLVSCSCVCHCSWEARLMCTASCATTKCSWAAGSAVTARGPDHRHHLLCSPSSASSMCSRPPTFRCTDVWNCPASWCVRQKNLC